MARYKFTNLCVITESTRKEFKLIKCRFHVGGKLMFGGDFNCANGLRSLQTDVNT